MIIAISILAVGRTHTGKELFIEIAQGNRCEQTRGPITRHNLFSTSEHVFAVDCCSKLKGLSKVVFSQRPINQTKMYCHVFHNLILDRLAG